MNILSDKQLEELGFTLLPKVTDECDAGFAYRIAEIKTSTSFIEVVNEYRNGKVVKQYTNYELIGETSEFVDVTLIKALKAIILTQRQPTKNRSINL